MKKSDLDHLVNFYKKYESKVQKQETMSKEAEELKKAKQKVAEKYQKKDWDAVNHDYEYGLGISKLIGFEDLMNHVAIVYADKYLKDKLKSCTRLDCGMDSGGSYMYKSKEGNYIDLRELKTK